MNSRRVANPEAFASLLDLIEQRFGVRLPLDSVDHLRTVCEHYMAKRRIILWEHGEAVAFTRKDYAKAVLISEVARLMLLREIDPWPRRKKKAKRK